MPRLAPALLLAALACRSAPEFTPPESALGPYSSSVAHGDLVFVAGQVGAERDGSFAVEVESALDRVQAELARHGLGLADCVTVTVYLTDMERYAELNEVYARRFPAPYPARACVAVAALPAGARVEIQATAAR